MGCGSSTDAARCSRLQDDAASTPLVDDGLKGASFAPAAKATAECASHDPRALSINGIASATVEQMRELQNQVGDMVASENSRGVKMIQEALLGLQVVVRLAAHFVIPPPGGQIVAAVVAITALVVKTRERNVDGCRRLAFRCNQLVRMAFPHEEALQDVPPQLKQCLLDLHAVCTQIKKFIEGVLQQNLGMKILSSTMDQIAQDLTQLDSDLTGVEAALQLCYSTQLFNSTQVIQQYVVSMNDVIQDLKKDAEKAEDFIKKEGGNEAICRNNEAIKDFAALFGGKDAVMLHLLIELKSLLQSRAVDEGQGPHNKINHAQLKLLWWDNFRNQESVKWTEFFLKFPSALTCIDASEMERLVDEFRSTIECDKLRLACDVERDDSLSAVELSRAFPPGTRLIDRVLQLKAIDHRKGANLDVPPLPKQLFGRQGQVQALVSALSPAGKERVAVVSGDPGVGKLTLAAAALRQLYDNDQALGGVWSCSMDGVSSHKDMMMRFIAGLSPGRNIQAIDGSSREAAALRNRLMDLSQRNAQLEVPQLKIVLVSREQFDINGLEGELMRWNRSIHHMQVRPLDLDDATDMVKTCCEGVSEACARAKDIAKAVGATPLMLGIVCDALNDGRLTVKQVLEGGGFHMQADSRMMKCVTRTLDTVRPDQRTLLLKMGLLLPGPFRLSDIKQLLGLIPSSWMGVFQRCRLLEVSGREGAEEYRVTSMLRETAQNMYLESVDAANAAGQMSAAACGITRQDMVPVWHKYILYCRDMVQKDLQEYRRAPMEGSKKIMRNRPWVHQVLRLIIDDSNLVVTHSSLPHLMDILLHLPYFANISYGNEKEDNISNGNEKEAPDFKVHDDDIVREACSVIHGWATEDTDLAPAAKKRAQGLCLAVKVYYVPDMHTRQMEDIIPVVTNVSALLDGMTDPEAQLVHALALRRKGAMLRDLGRCGESATALRKACACLDNIQAPNDICALELTLDLTELAGTLDYMIAAVSDIDEAEPVALKALDRAENFFGAETKHPVIAHCLTTLGYYHKGRGVFCDMSIKKAMEAVETAMGAGDEVQATVHRQEIASLQDQKRSYHEEALAVHRRALCIREATLGDNHLDVALSLQQAAISLQALECYEDTESNLLRSLEIRQRSLGEVHFLLPSTHKALAELYLAWNKPKQAIEYLERFLKVGTEVWGTESKRLKATAYRLAHVQRELGLEEEAESTEREYRIEKTV